jgi:hypothetical integral membrane protein (TIGR02206 family)
MDRVLDKFLYTNDLYRNFTGEHWIALFVFVLCIYLIVKFGKSLSESKKTKVLKVLSLVPLFMLGTRMILDWQLKGITLQDDLPLHLCRILAFIAPLVILYANKRVKSILYYLVLAGVSNAMITADITYSFPHYGYFMYWIYHGALLLLALFGILVMKSQMTFRAGVAAFISINVYFVVLHFINIALDSNYMYSRAKPGTASLMDYLGPWPLYILWLEVIAFGLIIVIYFIFKHLVRSGDVASNN